MVERIVENKEKFHGIEIPMITPFGDSSTVSQFAQTYELNSLTNVHLLLDPKLEFPKIFSSSLVPSFYIYRENRLVKNIKKKTKIGNLLN